MTAPAAKIGQIVLYHSPGTVDGGVDPFVVAAIVTMTPQEWQPGVRSADGEWYPTEQVAQPKANCVHLHVFWPPTTPKATNTPWQADWSDVPYGTGVGCWSEV